jgi:uncharacterized SAM-binding protein YcdF (DUF218 family)
MFILRKLLRLIINIDICMVCSILIAWLLHFLGYPHSSFLFVSISCVLIASVCIFPTGQWLSIFLENRFPQPKTLPPSAEGIIVLGSGFDFKTSLIRNKTCYNESIGRLIDFIALAKAHPHLKLVFTGGGMAVKEGINESAKARELFVQCGLDPARILFETESRDTIENARFSHRLVNPSTGKKWVLVTSAMHLPRAVGLFRKLGWDVVPYPVDYHTSGRKQWLNLSLLWALLYWWHSAHELVEMSINYFFGLSSSWIPGPNESNT